MLSYCLLVVNMKDIQFRQRNCCSNGNTIAGFMEICCLLYMVTIALRYSFDDC